MFGSLEAKCGAHSLESIIEGHNWFLNHAVFRDSSENNHYLLLISFGMA
jgi:hypothetical protein